MAGPTGGERRGDAWSGIGTGWAVTTTLVAGTALWGAIGYLLDRLFGTPFVLMAIGVVVGAAASIYLVYLRFGRDTSASWSAGSGRAEAPNGEPKVR